MKNATLKQRAIGQGAALLATIALLTISRMAPAAADNVLFYNNVTGVAAIGAVSPTGTLRDLKTHAFDRNWGVIVSASNGTLLFYNPYTGLTATARFAPDGSYTDLKTFNLSPGWSGITPLSQGKLLFYQRTTGLVVTGVLSTDGSYRDLKQFNGIGPGWDHIVATRNGTLLIYKLAYKVDATGRYTTPVGVGVTGRIEPDGSYVYRSGTHELPIWRSIRPIFGDGLLCYDSLNPVAHFVTLLPGTNDFRQSQVSGMGAWYNFVATSNNMLLLYSYGGEMATGNLVPQSANAIKFVPLAAQRIDPKWSIIVALP